MRYRTRSVHRFATHPRPSYPAPAPPTHVHHSGVAQLAEHSAVNRGVAGSIPAPGASKAPTRHGCGYAERFNTSFPRTSPSSMRWKARGASVNAKTSSIGGLIPVTLRNLTSCSSSVRVPIVDPTTRS